METAFTHGELAKMDWEDLTAQCISACAQKNFDRAERIRFNDSMAKIAQTSPDKRGKAEAEAYPYLVRMTEAINVFFPE